MTMNRRAFLSGLAACPVCVKTALAADEHWSYRGAADGPEAWGHLPGSAVCSAGREQSPVDLKGAVPAGVPDVAVRWRAEDAEVVNNGHTIQVNWPGGSSATVDGEAHELLQFHFHHPSEHKLDGRSFDLEVHFVHRNAAGGLAVLGVFFEPGPASPVLETVWNVSPIRAGGSARLNRPLDPSLLLPASPVTYRYAGSLTTPPCSETVSWVVYRSPVTASPAQFAAFAELFPMNARPLQPLNRRKLLLDVL